jgi:hypothetical protein
MHLQKGASRSVWLSSSEPRKHRSSSLVAGVDWRGASMPNSSLSKIPVAVCSRYFFGRSYSVGYGLLFGGLRITTMEYFA